MNTMHRTQLHHAFQREHIRIHFSRDPRFADGGLESTRVGTIYISPHDCGHAELCEEEKWQGTVRRCRAIIKLRSEEHRIQYLPGIE